MTPNKEEPRPKIELGDRVMCTRGIVFFVDRISGSTVYGRDELGIRRMSRHPTKVSNQAPLETE